MSLVRRSKQQSIMYLHTEVYLRTKEIRALTLPEYFTHSFTPTPSTTFTGSPLPFSAEHCLLLWEHMAQGCVGSLRCSCSQLPFSGVTGQDEDVVKGELFLQPTPVS